MPNPSAGRPRPAGSLDQTLQGIDTTGVDQGFLNIARNLPPPDLAPVPNKPGFGGLLLSSIGGALANNDTASADFIMQQQESIQEAQTVNRQLENQHRANQIDLIIAGRKEGTRRAELEAKLGVAATERERAARMEEARLRISEGHLALAQGKFDRDEVDTGRGFLQGYIAEADSLAEQTEELTKGVLQDFDDGVPARPFLINTTSGGIDDGPIPFHDPFALTEALKAIRGDMLSQISDPDHRADVAKQFDIHTKKFIDDPLKAYFAAEKKFVNRKARDEAVAKSTTTEGPGVGSQFGTGGGKSPIPGTSGARAAAKASARAAARGESIISTSASRRGAASRRN